MSFAFQATGLVKRFGRTTALAGVDLAAEPGTVLGVLGPNGAGKTTAVRILATLLRPDAGTAVVGGHDVVKHPAAVRRISGLTGQFASVDEDLTGTENLVLIGQLLDLRRGEAKSRAAGLLAEFDLSEAADRPVKTYSGGMRRRLDLAASLVGRPAIVYLDEPTTGLDPAKREDVWNMVRAQVREGTTVLLTTQYLEEADALADEISVIDHGKVIAHGTPAQLKHIVGGQTISVRPADPAHLDAVSAILAGTTKGQVESRGRGVLSVPVDDAKVLGTVIRQLEQAGIDVIELSLHLPSLDEVFFTLTRGTEKKQEVNRVTTIIAAVPGRPFGLVRHSLVMARRSLIKTMRTPEQLLDVTLQPIIFIVLFVYLLGGAIAGSRHDYLQFLLPALLVQNVLFASAPTGVSLNTDIKTGVFDRFRSLPIGRSAPLIGGVLGDMIRFVVAIVVMLGFGYVLGFRFGTNPLAVLAACLLVMFLAFSFSWMFVLLGMVVREPGAVQGLGFVIMFPLTFGTNVLVPTDTLPGWLQAWVKINPVADAMQATRGLMVGGPVADAVVKTLLWSVGILAVFAPLAVRAYRRKA